jgi:hypothetical protein
MNYIYFFDRDFFMGYLKIYIFFYFYHKKYTRLKSKSLKYVMFCNKYYGQANKDLQFLVLSNKKLIKKNILKTIKYFFLKKTFVAKKFFLSSKIKNYKIFKFLIFSNKRLKFKKSLLSEDFLVKKKVYYIYF